MKQPVVIEVATRSQGAQPQHRFCSCERPPGSGAAHAILYEVSARTLDDAGRDRQSLGEGEIVVEPCSIPRQVLDAFLDGLGGLGTEGMALDHAAQAGAQLCGGMPGEQCVQPVFYPLLGLVGTRRFEGVTGLPQVFEHVYDVEDDPDLDTDPLCRALDSSQLIAVAVDEDDPPAAQIRITPKRLIERVVD